MVGNWNRAKIEKLLRTNNTAVERAIVAIYDRQTADEKAVSDTKHTNSRGFSAAHAKRGSYYARWIRGGRRLSGEHIDKGREIALHYTQQLADIANTNVSQVTQIKGSLPEVTVSEFESQVVAYMKLTGEPRRNAESVVKNVMAGRCPDGCCGPDEDEPKHRIESEENSREAHKEAMDPCLKKSHPSLSCFCSTCTGA